MSEHPLERAFELAKSGKYRDIMDLESQLKQENYLGVSQHLGSPALRKQLQAIMNEAGNSEAKGNSA